MANVWIHHNFNEAVYAYATFRTIVVLYGILLIIYFTISPNEGPLLATETQSKIETTLFILRHRNLLGRRHKQLHEVIILRLKRPYPTSVYLVIYCWLYIVGY